MISYITFQNIANRIKEVRPDLEAEFRTYELRLLDDVQGWLRVNFPRQQGWTRDDVFNAEPIIQKLAVDTRPFQLVPEVPVDPKPVPEEDWSVFLTAGDGRVSLWTRSELLKAIEDAKPQA